MSCTLLKQKLTILVSFSVSYLFSTSGKVCAALLHVVLQHFVDQFLERGLRRPASLGFQLRHVAKQSFHFRGPEILRGHLHQNFPCFLVQALLVYTRASP